MAPTRHVFPGDSALPPSGNVPTRTNSPADVEIDSATRDSADGTLTFSATLVNPSFTATVFLAQGLITADQAEEIVTQAAQSGCGFARR